MRFRARYDQRPLRGHLLYVAEDYAIDFEPESQAEFDSHSGELGRATLGIDTLQLEAGLQAGRIVGIWGYFPRPGWKASRLPLPAAKEGAVEVDFERSVESGSSYSITGTPMWPRRFDASSGWVMTGKDDSMSAEYVEPLQGVVLGIADGNLVQLWMRPVFVDKRLTE